MSMDERKVDEILNTYASLFEGDIEKDLSKYREKQKKKKPKKERREFSFSFKRFAPLFVSLALVAIVLVVAIPNLIPFKNDVGTKAPSSDDVMAPGDIGGEMGGDSASPENVFFKESELSHLLSGGNLDVEIEELAPNYQIALDKTEYVLKEGENFVGVYRELYVFGEKVDTVFMHTVKRDTTLGYLSQYKNLSNNLVWQGLSVNYDLRLEKGFYTANVIFSDKNCTYYLEISGYDAKADLSSLLDFVFGKGVANE